MRSFQRVTEKVVQLVWQSGFKINLDKGKTECIATLRGKGAPQVRKQIFIEQAGKIGIEVPAGLTQSPFLQVVGRYTHLGTCIGQDLNTGGEIERRIGQAQTAFRTLQKPIFRNKRIRIATRFKLLESLVCTKLFYNSGVWGHLTPGMVKKLEHTMIGWFRQIVGDGFWCTSTTPDYMFVKLWSIPTVQVRLAIAQLRFSLAAFRNGRQTVWEFIKLEADTGSSSWFSLLTAAVRWFQRILPGRMPQDIDTDNLTPAMVESWFTGPTCPSKATLKLLLRKHLLQERAIAEVRDGYIQAFEMFRVRDLAFLESHGTTQGGTHRCNDCGATFRRAQQLQAHRWAKHQGLSLERTYVYGPTCKACGIKFWTTQRMQQHLRQSENFNRLLRLAALGIFIATMGGPPCETFSPARHLAKPPEVKGFWPRPLRSTSRLWGLDSLSMREIEQLRVGSKLYIHNSLLDLQIVLMGGYSLLEHPADPGEEPKASSWQTSFHRVYAAALPGCTPIRIDQWKYGAESVKPTVIRAMGGHCAKAELLRHQDNTLPFPSKRLSGTDSNGQFKTAAAKEYPWLLSRALASALLAEVADGVQTRPLRCLSYASLGSDFQWLQQFACKSSRIDANATFLPDYQG